MHADRKTNARTPYRGLGLLGAVAVLLAGMAGTATAAKNPLRQDRRCRAAISESVLYLTKVGLHSIDACHRARDRGKPPRENCNEISLTQGDTASWYSRAQNRLAQRMVAACVNAPSVLANYPGSATDPAARADEAADAIMAQVKGVLEQSAGRLQGAPEFVGDPSTVRPLRRCHAAVGRARSDIVTKGLRRAVRCQRRLDDRGTAFGPIDPACEGAVADAATSGSGRVDRRCGGISGLQVGSCSDLPGCLADASVEAAALIAAATYGGPSDCGNGQLELGEECDDGNLENGDGCEDTCRLTGPAVCGDGEVEGDEQCEDGNNRDDDECIECRTAVCGDGFVDITEPGVEECDDGNDVPADGCTNCRIDGKLCRADGIVANVRFEYTPRITGDILGLAAQLDYLPPLSIPGSITAATVRQRVSSQLPAQFRLIPSDLDLDADGVDEQLRMLVTSTSEPIPPGPFARVQYDCPQGTEIRPSDLPCTLEGVSDASGLVIPAERLAEEGVRCFVESIEGDDPVPTTTIPGQTTTTTTTTTTTRPTTTTTTPTTSSSTTTIVTTTTTTTIPETCGNGTPDAGEACDDGNQSNADDCLVTCQLNTCGDGFTDRQGPVTEECDDGNDDESDGCRTSCTACGNSQVTAPETCDDGNTSDADFCPGDCQVDFCQPTADEVVVTLKLTSPDVAAATLFLEYPEGKVDLQGTGTSVPAGVIVGPGTATVQPNDFDHAARLVVFDLFNFGTTDVATLHFTRCAGSPFPSLAEFGCTLEGNATDENLALVPGVTCSVQLPDPGDLCGDGITDPGEACDDGNALTSDDCLPSCVRNTCGDGFVDSQGPVTESCDDDNTSDADFCPSDCQIDFCQPTTVEVPVQINLSSPDVAAATVFVDYPEGRVALQGTGTGVPAELLAGPPTATVTPNDFDHALRLVVFDLFNFGTTALVNARFTGCAGAPLPSASDFTCALEGPATDENLAVVPNVTCSVSLP